MSPQFATDLADLRLLQTAHLLESLLEDTDDREAISSALAAVKNAHGTIRGLRALTA